MLESELCLFFSLEAETNSSRPAEKIAGMKRSWPENILNLRKKTGPSPPQGLRYSLNFFNTNDKNASAPEIYTGLTDEIQRFD